MSLQIVCDLYGPVSFQGSLDWGQGPNTRAAVYNGELLLLRCLRYVLVA